jgi:hypothetical protein
VDENFVLFESDTASLGKWWSHIPEKLPYTSLFFMQLGIRIVSSVRKVSCAVDEPN